MQRDRTTNDSVAVAKYHRALVVAGAEVAAAAGIHRVGSGGIAVGGAARLVASAGNLVAPVHTELAVVAEDRAVPQSALAPGHVPSAAQVPVAAARTEPGVSAAETDAGLVVPHTAVVLTRAPVAAAGTEPEAAVSAAELGRQLEADPRAH